MKTDSASYIGALLNESTVFLLEKGITSAKVDAELIFMHFLQMKRAELYLSHNMIIEEKIAVQIKNALQKRGTHYPLQYILNEVHFLNTKLYVDESVLIPRPETEFLCDMIIKEYKGQNKEISCLDIGTGSGAIAIAIKKELPHIKMEACDISDKALLTAKKNANANKVEIKFFTSDLFEKVSDKYDLIISNPPYVTETEYQTLEDELKHEPKNALVSNHEGLQHIFMIIENALLYMNTNAKLFIENGYQQSEKIVEFVKKHNYNSFEIIKDLCGIERFIKMEA
ncbi:MAG TPA: peptide chain release factor N(5)-glutamine methyltransferase [Candidatus Cloacimonadota bacterium]|nr:peptide chain release factor N(5)-glutamine methyltransferase [Candidatus Cloacimonadota bacterium]